MSSMPAPPRGSWACDLPDVNLLHHAYNREFSVHAAARGGGKPSSTARARWACRGSRSSASSGSPRTRRCSPTRCRWRRPAATCAAGSAARCHRPGPWDPPCGDPVRSPRSLGTAGNLTTDAHLAALAIEHQAELHSTDADFARFAGLRWRNRSLTRAREAAARPPAEMTCALRLDVARRSTAGRRLRSRSSRT